MSDNLCKKHPMTGGNWSEGGPPLWSRTWSRYKPPCINFDTETGGFTKEQLDMRRKAYVLNYNQRNSRPKKKMLTSTFRIILKIEIEALRQQQVLQI